MGGEEKDSQSMPYGVGRQPRRENVSEAVISKLLKDFTSAELFPQSADPSQSKATTTNSDCSLDEVVASLKHLHVRRLSQKKHRRAKKRFQQRKSSVYLLNLAIAAGNFQKPIVWPARLNCDCQKPKNASLLNPSRLKVDTGHASNQNGDTSGCCRKAKSSDSLSCLCITKCNNKHKTNKPKRYEDTFGYSSAVSGVSFRSLCQQNVTKVKGKALGENKAEACSDCGKHTQMYSHHFEGQQLFSNNPLMPLSPSSPSELLGTTPIHLSQTSENTCVSSIAVQSPTPTPDAQESSLSRLPLQLSSALGQQTSSATGLGRSCSQEVREMEDTNVNELASYLEDLLHIPRKMSTMAEMMYA